MKLPKKFHDRVTKYLKRYQSRIADERKRDVAEADTVSTVKDIFEDIFGYDKSKEVTAEYKIRNTYCDLAVVVDGNLKFLIEVKGSNVPLKDHYIYQAQNYGALEGVNWVILTNSIEWKLYNIQFGQPPTYQEVTSFSLADINLRNEEGLQKLFLLAREGLSSDAVSTFYSQLQLFNRFTVAQIILSDAITSSIRKELRKIFPGIKVDTTKISDLLSNEIIKRDALEGEKCDEAKTRMRKAARKAARKSEKETASALVENSVESST